MNAAMRIAAAAVAVAVIAIGGYAVLNGRGTNNGSGGSPSPSPSARSLPQLYRSEPFLLDPGAYAVDQQFDAGFTITLPENWTGLEHKSGFALLIKTEDARPFSTVPNLALLGLYKIAGAFEDPCRDEAPLDPAPQGIDGFVEAITHEVGIHAGPVSDTVVGGLPAKTFDITSSIDYETCPNSPASLWTFYEIGLTPASENNTGGRSRIWLVDVRGTLILINAELTERASEADAAELYQMVDSIHFK